jgi:hypothetical protein
VSDPAELIRSQVTYVDGTVLMLAMADTGRLGDTAIDLLVGGGFVATSEIVLAEVPHLVSTRYPDMVQIVRPMAWPLMLNQLDLVDLRTSALESAGLGGWRAGDERVCATIHLAVAQAIRPDTFVTGDAETAERARSVPDGLVGQITLID